MLPPTPTHSHSFSAHSHPLPLMFGPILLNLSPLSPMYSLSYQFQIHNQILSLNPTHHLLFQPLFSPCVLCAYVPYVLVCLCAFVFHVPMCLWNSFLGTLLPMSIYFICLCVLINMSGLFIDTVFFKKILVIPVPFFCNTSVSFLSAYFAPMLSLPMFFSAFISLMLKGLKHT